MQYYPTQEQAEMLAEGYQTIPVTCELLADTQTPVHLYLSVADKYEESFLLESAENGERWGRYSFIGFDPRMQIKAHGKKVTVIEDGQSREFLCENPFDAVDEILNEYKSPKIKELPQFCGGLVGYFGYDSIRFVEPKLNKIPNDDIGLPEIYLLLCDKVIAVDHLRHKLVLSVSMSTQGNFAANYDQACRRLDSLVQTIQNSEETRPVREKGTDPIQVSSNMTKQAYIKSVEEAKRYIYDGDIFQIVLSQRFQVDNPPDAFNVYRMLRATNPSPYMYYFKMNGFRIAGASPEMLVGVRDGVVSTRPIAGTIRRGKDEVEDQILEKTLLSDDKERAEHTMLVDLGRNDVGKVSRFGSVKVNRFMGVDRFSQLMHLCSDVTGELEEGMGCIDALKAVIPAGTLSGAPKIRAMELIDYFEPTKRGLYGGTIGYLGFDGQMDTCIAIRTVLFANHKAYIQSGGGIVADSVPENEFRETQTKAKAMIRAIEEAAKLE